MTRSEDAEPPSSPPALELRGVVARYGSVPAINGVDLAVAPRRTTVLLGASGSGKSTLLRLLLGLVRPTAGHVRVEGEILTPESALALRRRMGYVIQEGGLFPHLTIRENVALVARSLRWAHARVETRVAELAELARLPAELLDRYPLQLSGGQRQRVGLMRALMLDPAVLLLDEPLGALDPLIRAELQDELRRVFRRLGKTVVLVTHDLAEAGYLGDWLVLLHQGAVVQEGTLADWVEAPADPFVTRFVRSQRGPLDALAGRPS